jgi:nitrile hydratase subunit beta
MNGVHDMGGMQGFGAVEPEANEPVFHAPWEGRVLAMNRAMGYLGLWNIDIGRFSREQLAPDVYLGSSYYKKWTLGLEDLVVQYGLVGEDELAAGHALHPAAPVKRTLKAADAPKLLSRGSFERPAATPAQFEVGDRVRMKNIHPTSHTRLPRYVRGHVGVIECVRGCHVFPDAVVAGRGEEPHWLYTVVFDGRELWGEGSDPTVKVSVEAWEPYLNRAQRL